MWLLLSVADVVVDAVVAVVVAVAVVVVAAPVAVAFVDGETTCMGGSWWFQPWPRNPTTIGVHIRACIWTRSFVAAAPPPYNPRTSFSARTCSLRWAGA